MRRGNQQQQFAPASPLIVKTESTLRGLSLNEKPPILTSLPEQVQFDVSEQVLGPVDLRVAKLYINDRDTDQVAVDFVCLNPKEPAIVLKRKADIEAEQARTIKDWITHYDTMVFFVDQGGAGLSTLHGHLYQLYKERSGPGGIPHQVDFLTADLYCGRSLTIPGRYIATLQIPASSSSSGGSTESDDTCEMDAGSYDGLYEHGSNATHPFVMGTPTIKTYVKDPIPEILRRAALDPRPVVNSLGLWLKNGESQKRVDGIFQCTASKPGLPTLPKRLVSCAIIDFAPMGAPKLNYPKPRLGYIDLSYIDLKTGRDTIAVLKDFFIGCPALAGYRGLLVDINDPANNKDYTLIVYLENKCKIRCNVYEMMNVGQPQQTRLIDGCWVAI